MPVSKPACPRVVGKYLILHRAMQEPDCWSHLLNSSPAVYIPVALPEKFTFPVDIHWFQCLCVSPLRPETHIWSLQMFPVKLEFVLVGVDSD